MEVPHSIIQPLNETNKQTTQSVHEQTWINENGEKMTRPELVDFNIDEHFSIYWIKKLNISGIFPFTNFFSGVYDKNTGIFYICTDFSSC